MLMPDSDTICLTETLKGMCSPICLCHSLWEHAWHVSRLGPRKGMFGDFLTLAVVETLGAEPKGFPRSKAILR